MTCKHLMGKHHRYRYRWCFAVAEFTDLVEGGRCTIVPGTSIPDPHTDCRSRPATCTTAFPTSPAAQRWAACDDVATLRKRGQAYEHAWVKATARELDLMIEIERLRRKLAAITDENAVDEPR